MAKDYKVFLHTEIVAALPKSGNRRERIIEFVTLLGAIAHRGGDFQEIDPESGRTIEVSVVAGCAVSWWIDAPVNEVKIIALRSADQDR